MQIRSAGWWALSGVVLAVGGCGSSASTGNAPASASAACSELHAARAARAARCIGGAIADWEASIGQEVDCAKYDGYVAGGQVEYRREGWAACLSAYAGPCDESDGTCFWEVLHGLVGDGESCGDVAVCGTVSTCLAFDSDTVCGGICVRAGEPGETCGLYCGQGTPCGPDFPICRFDLACVNDVCVAPKSVGETCGAADPVPCDVVLTCTADPADLDSTGTCQRRVAGGPCHGDASCPGVEFCLQGTCSPRRDVGASCADAPAGCVPWAVCGPNGVCAAAGRPGLPCAPYPGIPDYLICSTGACDITSTCIAPRDVGDSCAEGVCARGSACDPGSLMCVACPS